MHSVVGFTVFGVDWEFLKPYIVLGLGAGRACMPCPASGSSSCTRQPAF